ncbi:MAG: rhomboid family intramembrane serine protease [Bacteroidetes bacterium]|nr:rhomboid family intramembrane serine protease [Bacteroidota bacterium]MBL0051166.1 rhomboid family intramembrane serine protease [Bacteroidota bacterium]
MSKWLNELKITFSTNNATMKLLMINVAVFVVYNIIFVTELFFNSNAPVSSLISNNLSLPSSFSLVIFKPWSYFTYMFFHTDVFHILFNMLALYWIGNLFEEYLGSKKLVAVYIVSGLCGGLLFQLAYNTLPLFSSVAAGSQLIGASAGIVGLMVATAVLIPNHEVMLILLGQVKLKWLVIVLVLLFYFNIPKSNAGGEISHLGGALFGYLFMIYLRKGTDLTKWMQNILGIFTNERKTKMRILEKTKLNDEQYNQRKKIMEETVDSILDKINKSGYNSLTKEEKDILYRASNRKS